MRTTHTVNAVINYDEKLKKAAPLSKRGAAFL